MPNGIVTSSLDVFTSETVTVPDPVGMVAGDLHVIFQVYNTSFLTWNRPESVYGYENLLGSNTAAAFFPSAGQEFTAAHQKVVTGGSPGISLSTVNGFGMLVFQVVIRGIEAGSDGFDNAGVSQSATTISTFPHAWTVLGSTAISGAPFARRDFFVALVNIWDNSATPSDTVDITSVDNWTVLQSTTHAWDSFQSAHWADTALVVYELPIGEVTRPALVVNATAATELNVRSSFLLQNGVFVAANSPPPGGSVGVLPTRLNLKVFPNKVYASSLDGFNE